MGLRDRIAVDREQRGALDGTDYYRRRLLEEVDFADLMELTESQRRIRLERIVGQMVTREGPVMTTSQRTALIRQVIDEAIGLGVLEPLLADESITEIMVNGPGEIWIERDGRIEPSKTRFSSEAQLYQTIDRIVSQVNRRVDEASPMVDARLPSGERVNVIIPPLSMIGPVITIRRFPRRFTLAELVELQTLDEPTRRLLSACVRGRMNVVISGGTGAGKTTLLNALSAAILERERIVTIEEAAELQLQQPHVIALEARPPNVEGKGEVTIRDLVRNSLRMRPDRIIVGEVRGVETFDMLQALNTGHEGSLVTVHANSADDALYRLETLASMSDLHIPHAAVREYINNAIQVIVQIDRGSDGRRRVTEVAMVASQRGEPFRLQTAMRYEADDDASLGAQAAPATATSRARQEEAVRRIGVPRHYALPERVTRWLWRAGVEVPLAFARAAQADAPTREAR
ncbi:MAG: CpaF family protein [Solirubrobacterales bacterium]|nr:CpaF family protein [Solirubrobacterales bacterium]MBV9680723.1 CpaF family protein [Solirubrobacterales bacterium]